MTYRTLLKQAQKNCDKSRTEYLLQGITNKKVSKLYLDDSSVPQDTINKFNRLLQEKSDKPIQYILQKAYFLSYELYVDERVLIPRFETEELVVKTAVRFNVQDGPKNVLDIGTGSGAIAIALADLFPQANIVAADISAVALEVAKINIKKHGFQDRIRLFQSNIFPDIKNIKFDLIISNPPYIPEDEMEKLNTTVKDYEPLLALDGGKQGFEIIERILCQAKDWLKPDGLLALELDPRQAPLIKCLITNDKCQIARVEFEKDNQGFIRYAFIKYK
jgi:release factor glutamine methyltransferase